MKKVVLLCVALLLPAAALSAQVETRRVEIVETPAPLTLRGTITKAPFSPVVIQQKRVDLDLDNATLPEAIQVLSAKSGEKIEVAADVPKEPRVTLHARNISFGTALQVLTENASAATVLQLKDGKPVFRVVKTSSEGGGAGVLPPPGVFYQNTLFDVLKTAPDGAQGFINLIPPGANYSPGSPTAVYRMHVNELRSTFTCPHCKGQVTALRTRQEPKCPKCGRLFQGDWQFCPADGTKRPATSDDWRYCPLCGKRIDLEKPRAEDPAK